MRFYNSKEVYTLRCFWHSKGERCKYNAEFAFVDRPTCWKHRKSLVSVLGGAKSKQFFTRLAEVKQWKH